jgi:hydrogenase-4 component J
VEALPEGGGARRKLAGLLRFGEITVDSSHTAMLRHSFALALPSVDDEASEWLQAFDAALEIIVQEPVVYLMGRRIA